MGTGFHEDNEIKRLRSILSGIVDVLDDDGLTQAQQVAQIRQVLDLPEAQASQANGQLPDGVVPTTERS